VKGKRAKQLHTTHLCAIPNNSLCDTNSPAVSIAYTHTKDLHHKIHATANSLHLTEKQAKMCPNVVICSISETPNKKFVLCLNSRGKKTRKLYNSINRIF
jgi:hypothetical protein